MARLRRQWLSLAMVMATLPAFAADQPSSSPAELVRRVVANELKTPSPPVYYRYRLKVESPRGVREAERVETPEISVGRTVLLDGKAPTAEQAAQWERSAQQLLQDAKLREQRREQQKAEQERINKLMAAIPDAFVFEPEGAEANGLVRLKGAPNPKFDPPSRETQPFRGMDCVLWIEPRSERLARFEGTLFKDVDFGWGLFGRLYRGGHVLMENSPQPDGSWVTTSLSLQLTGRILLFKKLEVDQKQTVSDIRPVRPMTLAEAVELLRKLPNSPAGAK